MSGPEMPIHAANNGGWLVYLVLMSAAAVGLITWWAFFGERRKTGWVLPMMMLGGSISTLMEPTLDNIVLFWYPLDPDFEAFCALGRHIPWAIPIGYGWFVGGLPFLAARYFARGIRPAQFWRVAAMVAVIDFLAIGSCSWLNVAGFYGSDVFRVAGYPLWWAPFDIVIVCGGGALLFLLKPFLKGSHRLILVAVPIIMTALVTGLFGPLITTALRDEWSTAGMVAASLATLATGVGVLAVICKAVVAAPKLLPACTYWGPPTGKPDVAPLPATSDSIGR